MRLIIGFLAFLVASPCYGDFITFSAEVNSGGSPKIVIDNRSDANWEMVRATFDFGGTPVNLVNPRALAFGSFGSYSTVNTIGGLSSLTDTLISNQQVKWTFSALKSGDGYGIGIDLGDIRGPQINGSTIEAMFRNATSGETRGLTYLFEGVQSNGRSFPAYASASVPEPGVGLLLSAFGLLGFSRLRIRR